MAEMSPRFNFDQFDNLIEEGLAEYEEWRAEALGFIATVDAEFEDIAIRYNPDPAEQ
jgi:uncharacterized YccA/Bax inhibitor family protein